MLTRSRHVLPEGHGTTACQLRTRPYRATFLPPAFPLSACLPPPPFFYVRITNFFLHLSSSFVYPNSSLFARPVERSFLFLNLYSCRLCFLNGRGERSNVFDESMIEDELLCEEFRKRLHIVFDYNSRLPLLIN